MFQTGIEGGLEKVSPSVVEKFHWGWRKLSLM